MKKTLSFFVVMLIGWNLVISIQLYRVSNEKDTSIPTTTDQGNVSQARVEISSNVSDLVEKSENKVVTVTATLRNRTISSGSGAIYRVDGKDVYIITNNHVVADGDGAIVTFASGEEVTAEIKGLDEVMDLALLKVSVDFDAQAFTMGDSSLVKKGEYVIAMGSPLGIEYQGSVSGGLISGVDRHMEVDTDNNGVADFDVNVLQTDAAINPGNSGGPLINMAGELIGINSMKISAEDVEGFGFALPINEVLPVISQLEKDGKVTRPILGISVQEINQLNSFERSYFDINTDVKAGLYIMKVNAKSPASKAGIKNGDVLVKFDGKECTDFKTFRTILYTKKIGDKVTLTINRDGEEKNIEVTLE
ncbi:S1C family serine protease [[Eubacterium] hominis]|uniref:S1C family serine protease n=1 Tax=[Eubacterium] hominis TaxID=2764325 RepID=UPI003A4D56CC